MTLSNEERRVINMHRNLERYLELPESDRITGGETVDTARVARGSVVPRGTGRSDVISADLILETAARLIDTRRGGGVHHARSRRATRCGGHVDLLAIGGRDKLFDSLVERTARADGASAGDGDNAIDRIASLARSQRRMLIDEQHLLAIAHERNRTPQLFMPIQQALAAQLADLG